MSPVGFEKATGHVNLDSAVDRLFPQINPDEYLLLNTRPPSPIGRVQLPHLG
jgi:hypothetical protein